MVSRMLESERRRIRRAAAARPCPAASTRRDSCATSSRRACRLKFETLSENAARDAVRRGARSGHLDRADRVLRRRFAAALPAPVAAGRGQRGLANPQERRARAAADGRLRQRHRAAAPADSRRQSAAGGAVAVNEIDVATPTGRAVVVLGFMTYFILFAVLMGGPVSGHRFHRGRARAGLARGTAQPAGGTGQPGRGQDTGDLRLYVPVARDQPDGLRVRVSLRVLWNDSG